MTSKQPLCLSCGAPLGEGLLAGICPACVMKNLEDTVTAHGLQQTTTDWSEEEKTKAVSTIKEGDAFGPYQIISKLGQGGMGIVYEALHQETSRRVALKVLARGLQSPSEQTRFFQEGRLAASINSPNTVYVYSTGTIENLPVISMELVDGQTLQEKVEQQGPLSIGEAIDCIMDVITGLMAAEKQGVLHRDIKPSNCFEDSDGRVRVGDFGLSISTEGAPQTGDHSDTFMGTPAFASPEQIRCQKLSVQSDLYSVGMTLYFLLTGKTAFKAKNASEHMSNVLHDEPKSPLDLRPDLPSRLHDTLLKCLEKVPSKRFLSYEELQESLRPFASKTPEPARPLQRIFAGILDGVVPNILSSLFLMLPLLTLPWYTYILANFFSAILNYILLEGLTGASCGKHLVGLKVIGEKDEPPGLWVAFKRCLPLSFGTLFILIFNGLPNQGHSENVITALSFVATVLTYSLFITMRKRNGYQALHDRWSSTRVVVTPKFENRSLISNPPISSRSPNQESIKVGDYHLIETLEDEENEKWILAYDAYLNRKVWIHQLPEHAPPLEQHLCNLCRPERIRWITGRREGKDNWDVYEAPEGQPFLDLIQEPQPWGRVRFWLFDMIKELKTSKSDHTRPETITLQQLWITSEGRAKLLSFPAPGIKNRNDFSKNLSPKKFLKTLAYASLEGSVKRKQGLPLEARIPLKARTFIENGFQEKGNTKLNYHKALPRLKKWTESISQVTRRPRVIAMAIWVVAPLIFLLSFSMTFQSIIDGLEENPEILEIHSVLTKWKTNQIMKDIRLGLQISKNPESKAPLSGQENQKGMTDIKIEESEPKSHHPWSINDHFYSIVLSAHFKKTLQDRELTESLVFTSFIREEELDFLNQSLERYPNPTPEEVEEAEIAIFGPDRKNDLMDIEFLKEIFEKIISFLYLSWVPLFGMLPTLMVSIFGKTSLLFSIMGIQLVNRSGEAASRWRILLRCFLFWLHYSIFIGGISYLVMNYKEAGFLISLFILAGMVYLNLKNRDRDLWDRFSGLWLVPKG